MSEDKKTPANDGKRRSTGTLMLRAQEAELIGGQVQSLIGIRAGLRRAHNASASLSC